MSIGLRLEELDRVRKRPKRRADGIRLVAYLLIVVGSLAIWALVIYGLVRLL